MQNLNTLPYLFTAELSASTLTFGLAKERDAARLAELYKNVHIGRNNYKTRLDPESPENFRACGGMFLIPDQNEIEKIIQSERSLFAVARLDGEIFASLWVSLHDPSFSSFRPPDVALRNAIDDERVLYLREIVVARECIDQKIPMLFNYTLFQLMQQFGYTHSVAEVYKLDSYFDGSNHVVNLFNERSFQAILSSGGRAVGTLPRKILKADGFMAQISSTAVWFEHETVLPILENKLTHSQILVQRGVLS